MRKDEFPIVDKLVKDSINDVLDKIKTEIAEYKDDKIIHEERNEMIDIILEIIDKHIKEIADETDN